MGSKLQASSEDAWGLPLASGVISRSSVSMDASMRPQQGDLLIKGWVVPGRAGRLAGGCPWTRACGRSKVICGSKDGWCMAGLVGWRGGAHGREEAARAAGERAVVWLFCFS